MKAVVIFESLTGNTRKAAGLIAAELERRGVPTTVSAITAIDYQALEDADLVIVGSWTDGLLFFGQRPGRAGRLRKLPFISGKRCVVFCTYAIDSGGTLDKLVAILEDRGAEVLGGMAIRRDNLPEGSREFVSRVLDVVAA
ncbi:MAG: flavodoxin domain-containing protein [Actinobacteria bacterium]|nr:flavodoxin domain-containing protein [Actinomycetota bacterium]MBW3649832.1 flavodoxin domain-containing protein [Actinomycetota bacterium]